MTEQSHNQLSEVLQKVNELAQKASGGDYLYRGEPEFYENVSSSLYREYSDIEAAYFNIAVVQDEMLQEAKRFIGLTDEDAILEQLQHFGYPTNQIDFTTDYNIALFFACYSKLEKDGRVILLDKAGRDDLKQPKAPENRVIAQKSVFVRPPNGFVEPNAIVVIPQELKEPILAYLDKFHGVNEAALFNDIHGFIRYHSVHASAYAEFYAGLTHYSKGEYDKAIESYSTSIDLNPRLAPPHINRGATYDIKGEYDRAIQDYDIAIELNPGYADAYYNRGRAYVQKCDYVRAIQDFDIAIELDPGNVPAHINRGAVYDSNGEYDRAIQDFNRAIELNSGLAGAYSNRGVAYFHKGDYHRSIQDYDRAIALDPDFALVYCNRGVSWLCLKEWGNAESDLSKAQSLVFDIASVVSGAFGSIAAFEQRYNVKLPANIAAKLTPQP